MASILTEPQNNIVMVTLNFFVLLHYITYFITLHAGISLGSSLLLWICIQPNI